MTEKLFLQKFKQLNFTDLKITIYALAHLF
jgi:hypothetical protein